MIPIDFRNDTWASIQGRLDGLREAVYHALRQHGPCTTRELALKSGIDILTVRPRVTELCQLGLAASQDSTGHEGTYRAVSLIDAQRAFEAERRRATEVQPDLFG